MTELTLAVALARLTCSECGITHAVPQLYADRRREDHRTFYCPNGHGQHFAAESEAERLRKKLHAETLARESADRRVREAVASREAAEREAKRMKTRAKAGVCPCCNRTFQQLVRHMSMKHPEFKA